MKRLSLIAAIMVSLFIMLPGAVRAEEYVIDTKKSHAFIEFKISHLGFSWILGRFNTFEGEFAFNDEDPAKSKVSVTIDTSSVDTNLAERDKHLRSDEFLDVKKYPEATFKSSSIELTGEDSAVIKGDFTLHGVTREIEIKAKHIGAGKDPWGGFRRGFEGRTSFALHDYDMTYNLGPASKEIEIFITFEGLKKK